MIRPVQVGTMEDRAVRIGVSDTASADATVTFEALRILRIVTQVMGGETQAGQ